MDALRAAQLYKMIPHEENGLYVEKNDASGSGGRETSGCIYYYLKEDERSSYHVIDCDEYWIWCAGAPLEVWKVSPDGELTIDRLGLGEGMEPVVLVRAGTIFGARHGADAREGTFMACITVPRFRYEGWRLVPTDEVARLCPDAQKLYEQI